MWENYPLLAGLPALVAPGWEQKPSSAEYRKFEASSMVDYGPGK